MSGEKCSTIEVSDRTTLFDAWRNASRERAQREEARRREREEREETERREWEEQEETERREREEAERRERAAQLEREALEREALERARGRLAALEAEFESLRDRASEMQTNMSGIELPAEPTLAGVNRDDTGAILESLSGIESTIAAYRSSLNASMLRYSRDRADDIGSDEVLDWYGSFVAPQPGAAIGFANNEALAGREAQANELRRQTFERAREKMAEVERRVVHVSEELRGALEAVLNAPSLPDLRPAEARLESMVKQEIARADEEEARRHEELERLQTDRVAAVMAESLADMGYVVSNVYESAYTRDGQIFACRQDDRSGTEHAVRLTIDRETRQVTSNVVRIVDADDPPTRSEKQREQDLKADSTWCDSNGIVRFEEKLKDRGVKVGFASNGSRPVGTVSAADVAAASPTLEAHLRAARRPAAVRQQPKARSRPAP